MSAVRVAVVARIGQERVAFDAAAVQSVIERGSVSTVPRAPAHIAGISALRSQALTVVDCAASIGLDHAAGTGGFGIVIALDGCLYSLLVDDVEGVGAIHSGPNPITVGLTADWERVALGIVEAEAGAMLLLDPAAIVAGPSAPATQAA